VVVGSVWLAELKKIAQSRKGKEKKIMQEEMQKNCKKYVIEMSLRRESNARLLHLLADV
jgi:hypothetical protein